MARHLATIMHTRGRPTPEALARLHNVGIMWFPCPAPLQLRLEEDAGLILVGAPRATAAIAQIVWEVIHDPTTPSGLLPYYAAPMPITKGFQL